MELGFNLFHHIKPDDKHCPEFISVFQYLIELGSFDLNPTIREFTRFIKLNTIKDNLIPFSTFLSFGSNLLFTPENEKVEEDPNYGYISTLVKYIFKVKFMTLGK